MLGRSVSGPIAGRWPVRQDFGSARTARGWSQERLVREIEQYARQHVTRCRIDGELARLRVRVGERQAHHLGPLRGDPAAALSASPTRSCGAAPSACGRAADGYDELLSRIDSARSVSSIHGEDVQGPDRATAHHGPPDGRFRPRGPDDGSSRSPRRRAELRGAAQHAPARGARARRSVDAGRMAGNRRRERSNGLGGTTSLRSGRP